VTVRIIGDAGQITDAINRFSSAYHADFSEVRAIGRQYLDEAVPTDSIVADLAQALRKVLSRWGAGERKAPQLQDEREFANVLRQSALHGLLAGLGGIALSNLTVEQSRRLINGRPATFKELMAFDLNLFGALRILGERLFHENTNATYPMKALLLITGLMPAFDSQVRRGLQRGGFLGMDKTQFLVPTDASCADGKKIARLPFLLAECRMACSDVLRKGIINSSFAELLTEPGRVFDVLFFVQGHHREPVLVICDPPGREWYFMTA
jgi:hypothetical protein